MFAVQKFANENDSIRFETANSQKIERKPILKGKQKEISVLSNKNSHQKNGKKKNKTKNLSEEDSIDQKEKKIKITDGGIVKSKHKKQNQMINVKLPANSNANTAPKKKQELMKSLQDEGVIQMNSPSSFESRLKQELVGGRFRYINEQLYTMTGSEAQKMFHDEPEAFTAYHEGYRSQVAKWPVNPMKRIIKLIMKLPKVVEIGDFGCGEGLLAKAVPHKVHSMDLVSTRPDIIACDMAHTPLPDDCLDLAVFCLSLMGTNLSDYIIEANRVLKLHGQMYIVEIQSRFDNVKKFSKDIEKYGFELIKHDSVEQQQQQQSQQQSKIQQQQPPQKNLLCFFQFRKVRNHSRVMLVPELSLKPCLYKKR